MYRCLYIIGILLTVQIASAQRYEIGAFLGGSNTISDVGSTYYVYPNEPAFGGLVKWNMHERLTLRFQITAASVRGDDSTSDIRGKINRQFSYKNHLLEFTTGLEFNFYSFRIKHLLDKPMTPYVYMGIAGFWQDDLYFNAHTQPPVEATDTTKRSTGYAIPVIFGIKKKITSRLILAGEVGFRYSLTNNLDGSDPQGRTFTFGNKATNDWYTFTGFTLTYTFGEEPCYCRK